MNIWTIYWKIKYLYMCNAPEGISFNWTWQITAIVQFNRRIKWPLLGQWWMTHIEPYLYGGPAHICVLVCHKRAIHQSNQLAHWVVMSVPTSCLCVMNSVVIFVVGLISPSSSLNRDTFIIYICQTVRDICSVNTSSWDICHDSNW